MTEELKPCPFCGKIPEIIVCDEEGNVHEDDYEKDPWSGLSFLLNHGNDCLISLDEIRYYKKEDAIKAWNSRPEEERLRKRIEELEKCLAKFTKWDRDFPVGYSPYSGLYEFNAIIAEAEELLKGSDHE